VKRLVLAGLAALAVGLVAAPVAGASPDAHTMRSANGREFIAATDRVITMSSGYEPVWRWVGYPKVPIQLRINTAHTVCSTLDTGISGQGINDMIVTSFDDRREHAGYFAAWFEQIAVEHYCPRHTDKMGII
jgi:hypothetical protein